MCVCVCVCRRMRQNRLKYAPVLKGGTLTSDTPAKPAPYTHYTRDRRDDDAVALSSVLTPKDTGVWWPKILNTTFQAILKAIDSYV